MNPTEVRITKQFMTTRLGRLVAGAALSAALMTIAAPALAQLPPEPGGGGIEQTVEPQPVPAPVPAPGSVDLSSAALGALGGLALGGAGLGITLGIQRRREHAAAHPA